MRIRAKVWSGENLPRCSFIPSQGADSVAAPRPGLNLPVEPLLAPMAQKCSDNLDLCEMRDLWKLFKSLQDVFPPLEVEKVFSHLKYFHFHLFPVPFPILPEQWVRHSSACGTQALSQTFTQTGFNFCFTPSLKEYWRNPWISSYPLFWWLLGVVSVSGFHPHVQRAAEKKFPVQGKAVPTLGAVVWKMPKLGAQALEQTQTWKTSQEMKPDV